MTTYTITVGGKTRATFRADLSQAAAPITLDGEPTPFQTADASHCEVEAAEKLIAWSSAQGGPIVDENEEWEVA